MDPEASQICKQLEDSEQSRHDLEVRLAELTERHEELEKAMARQSGWFGGDRMMQADVTVAVGWRFMQHEVPEIVTPKAFPRLAAHSARAEALPAFIETGF